MRRLALLPLVILAFACTDSTLIQPEGDADLQISAKTTRNPDNPFVGVWWGIDTEGPNDTHHLTIGHGNAHGVMPVKLRDSQTDFCGGGWIRSRQMTGEIVAENVLKLSNLLFVCEDGTLLDFGPFLEELGVELGYVADYPDDEELCYTFLTPPYDTFDCAPILYRKKPWKD